MIPKSRWRRIQTGRSMDSKYPRSEQRLDSLATNEGQSHPKPSKLLGCSGHDPSRLDLGWTFDGLNWRIDHNSSMVGWSSLPACILDRCFRCRQTSGNSSAKLATETEVAKIGGNPLRLSFDFCRRYLPKLNSCYQDSPCCYPLLVFSIPTILR